MAGNNEVVVRTRLVARSKVDDNTWITFVGAAATTCGTITAIALIPDDPQPSGALFWPAFWCTAGLLTAPLSGVRRKIVALLRTEHVLMIGLVYWLLLDPLQGAYPLDGVSREDVVLAFTAIGTMGVAIWLGAAGHGWSPPKLVVRVVKRPLNSASLFLAIWISFFLGMFYFAYSSDFDLLTMINGLGKDRFSAPWSRGSFGGAEAFVEHLKYFGYVLPSLVILIAHLGGWAHPRSFLGIIMSAVMIVFLAQDGGRRTIGVIIGAALVTWLLLQDQIRPKLVIGGIVGVSILLLGMETMLQFRSVGFSAIVRESGGEIEISRLHVDDNFLRLSQIGKFFPEVHPYVDLQPVIYAMARPVPRVFWSDKPSDPGYDLSELAGMSGLSLSHSLVGELYAMHGLFMVLVGGVIFGRVAKMWSNVLNVQGGIGKPIVYGLGVMTLVAALRSMQDLVIMSYGLLGWFVIASFFGREGATSKAD
jgi:hypothetical protein